MKYANFPLSLAAFRSAFIATVVFCFLLSAQLAKGQLAASSANYAFATGTNASLALDVNGNAIDMSTGTTTLIGPGLDAATSGLYSLGFDFYLMGVRFNTFSVNEDGILQLGGASAVGSNIYTITGGTATAPRLSAFNADLRTGTTTGKVHAKVVGSPGSNILVVEFNDMQVFYTGTAAVGSATWQMRLYEGTGIIEYVYGAFSVSNITAGNRSPSVGFYCTSTTNNFVSINYTTLARSVTAAYAANTAVSATGPIANLNSAANGSRRYFRLTPSAPSAPTNLTFSLLTQTTYSLGWTNNGTGRVGTAIYVSTDNINFNYLAIAAPAAAGSNSTYSITGMTPGTTYYWKLYAVSEGNLSTALTGTQATLGYTQYYSKTTGALNTLATWGTNTDGTGTAPANFSNTYVVYNVRNNPNPTITATWSVASTTSKVIVGDGTNAINFTIPALMSVSGGGRVDVSANATLTILNTSVPTSYLGVLDAASTVVYGVAGAQAVAPVNYGNLTFTGSGTRSNTGTVGVSGVFDPGAITSIAGTVDFNSPNPQTIPALSYVTITNTGNGDRTLSGVINISGSNGFNPGTGIYTITGSTLNYTGSNSQTLILPNTGTAYNYNNLTMSTSGSITLPGSTAISGDFTQSSGTFYVCNISAPVTFDVGGDFNISGGTTRVLNSTNAAANGTVNVTGNTTVSGTGSIYMEANSNTTGVAIFQTTDFNATGTSSAMVDWGIGTNISNEFRIKGNFNKSGTGTFSTIGANSANGFIFNGTGTQTFSYTGTNSAETSYAVDNGATLQMLTGLYMNLNASPYCWFRVRTGGTLDMGTNSITGGGGNQSFILASGGTLITANPNGVYGASSSISNVLYTSFDNAANYVFNGSSAQNTNFNVANPTMGSLTIDNASGVTLTFNNVATDATVNGNLTLTNGRLITGANTLIVANALASAVTRTSGYVDGNLRRAIATGTNSYLFPVGIGTSYLPITLAYSGATSGGNVTATPVAGPHAVGPAIGNTNYVTPYWTLTNSGVVGGFSPSFGYNTGNITGSTGAQTSYVAANYNGGSWSAAFAATNTGSGPYTTSVNSVQTSYGDYVVGEPSVNPILSASALAAYGNVCINTTDTKTFTVTGNNLNATQVTLAAVNGYTYSTNNSTFTTTLQLTPVAGEISQLVYVKFSPLALQAYNGSIGISGGGATATSAAVSGTGVNTALSVTTGGVSNLAATTVTLAGTFNAGCTTVTSYGIEYSTTNNFTPGTGTPVASTNQTGGSYTSGVTGLTALNTYYYRAYAVNGTGTVYGSQSSFSTPIVNDDICNAIQLTPETNCTGTTGTVLGATASGQANTCGGIANDDVWYKFIATNTSHTIVVNPSLSFDAVIQAYSASTCGGTLTSLGCADGPGNGGSEILTLSGLSIGSTYYTRIYDYAAGTPSDPTFTICIFNPPANDEACGAISLNPNPTCSTTAGSWLYAGQSQPGCSGTANEDVWYKFTATATSHTISAQGGGASNIVLEVFSGSCGSLLSLSCRNSTGNGAIETANLTSLVIGNTYYIRVFENGAGTPANLTFNLCVVGPAPAIPPSCVNVLSPSEGVINAQTSPNLQWFAAATATSYNVYFGTSANPPLVANVSTTNYAVTCLEPSTQYFWRVDPVNQYGASTGCTEWTFTTSGKLSIYAQNFNGFTEGMFSEITAQDGWLASSTAAVGGYRNVWSCHEEPGRSIDGNSIGISAYYLNAPDNGGELNYYNDLNTNRYISRTIATTGFKDVQVSFRWQAGGQVSGTTPVDYGYVDYSLNGSTFIQGTTGGTNNQNQYYNNTVVTDGLVNFPSTADNNPNFKVAFGWFNNSDAQGFGPTFVVDDIVISGCPGAGSISPLTTTLAAPGTVTISITSIPVCSKLQWEQAPTSTGPWTNVVGGSGATTNNYTTDVINSTTYFRCKVYYGTCTPSYQTTPAVVTLPCTPGTWTGLGGDNIWTNAANWSCNTVPTASTDVTIPAGVSTYPVLATIAGNPVVGLTRDLTVASGASISISGGGNAISVARNFTNNGTSNLGLGSLRLNNAGSHIVSGSFTIGTLTVEAAATITGNVNITDALNLVAGALNTQNGSLTLKSNAANTAYINDFTAGYTGTITGNVTVERYVANTVGGFHYVGAPVGGTNIGDWSNEFSTAGPNNVFVTPQPTCDPNALAQGSAYGGLFDYRESNVTTCYQSGWRVRSSGNLSATEGYAGVIPNGTTINVTGTANTGNVNSATLTRTANNATTTQGMHLVSNPYPSAVDWYVVDQANPDIDGTAYLWLTSGGYQGTYQQVNALTPGTSFIGSSQGFFVEALGNGSVVNFTNAARVTGNNNFQRTGQAFDSRIILEVSGNGFNDRTIVAFGNDFTTGYDRAFDGKKMQSKGGVMTLYTHTNTAYPRQSTNALPNDRSVKTVPVGFAPGANGNFTFTADDLGTFATGTLIFLEDKKTGTMHNLMQNPNYTFTGSKGDAEDRFVLHFVPGMEVSKVDADCQGLNAAINIDLGVFDFNGTTVTWDNLNIIDATGNLVFSAQNVSGVQTQLGLVAGDYNLELTIDGYNVASVITLGAAPAVAAVATASDNTVLESEVISFSNNSTGATSYAWNFGDGSTSIDADPMHSYAAEGTYTVTLTATNSVCTDVFTQTITVNKAQDPTGINGIDNGEGIRIFGYERTVTVRFSNWKDQQVQLDIYDLTGRKVLDGKTLNTSQGEHRLKVENVVSGYYFVRVQGASGTAVERVFLGE